MAGMVRLVDLMRLVASMSPRPVRGGRHGLHPIHLVVLSMLDLRRSVAGSVVSVTYRLVVVIHLRHPVRHDPQLLLWLIRIARCQQDSEVVRPFHASMHRELHRKLRLLPRLERRRPDDNAGRSAPFQDFRNRWNGKAQWSIARVADQEAGLDHLVHGDIPKIDSCLVYHQIWRALRASYVELSALAGLPGQQAHHSQNADDGQPGPKQPRGRAFPCRRYGWSPGTCVARTCLAPL